MLDSVMRCRLYARANILISLASKLITSGKFSSLASSDKLCELLSYKLYSNNNNGNFFEETLLASYIVQGLHGIVYKCINK
jgi:hypothetical protein